MYVKAGATGNGSSWNQAAGNLATALNSATAGTEVWVASGTYTPTSCSPCSDTELRKSFVLPPGVRLLGGFSGSETNPAQRLTTTSPTILSGEIEPGIDTVGSRTVLLITAPTPGTVIDGITFTHGRAMDRSLGLDDKYASGSLLYITSPSTTVSYSLAINNCTFTDGRARGYGGAICSEASFDRSSQLSISACSFTSCSATVAGGAITLFASFRGVDSSQISACSFRQNSSQETGGGAIYLSGAEQGRIATSFTDVSFRENITGDGGGAILMYGKSGDCSPTFTNLTCESNEAKFGGALYLNGSYEGRCSPTFRSASLRNNRSVSAGGAVYVASPYDGTADPAFYQVDFLDNISGESGGAILVNAIEGSSRPLYRDCRFQRNSATLYGGGLYHLGRSGTCNPTLINCLVARNSANSAGGMYSLGSIGGQSNALIINSAFVDNTANVGGGLYSNGNDTTGTVEPLIVNTIFHGNTASFGSTFRVIYATPRALNCSFDVADCAQLNSGTAGNPICLAGNLFASPDPFVSRANQDYRLKAGAALIDAGVDSSLLDRQVLTDLSGNARFRGSATDIGPIEYAADPLLWQENNLPSVLSICQGGDVQLAASFEPPYPATYRWQANGQQLATTLELGPVFPANSTTYTLTAEAFGEVRTYEVDVDVTSSYTTTVSLASPAPDTLCIDSLTTLQLDVDAENHAFDVVWRNITGDTVSTSLIYTLIPTAIRHEILTATVYARDDCADVPSRSLTVEYDVAACASSTVQDIDYQPLNVWPNPVDEELNVPAMAAGGEQNFIIYSAIGEPVLVGMNSDYATRVNVSSLAQGVYAILVWKGQTYYRGSFVKL